MLRVSFYDGYRNFVKNGMSFGVHWKDGNFTFDVKRETEWFADGKNITFPREIVVAMFGEEAVKQLESTSNGHETTEQSTTNIG